MYSISSISISRKITSKYLLNIENDKDKKVCRLKQYCEQRKSIYNIVGIIR